MVDVKGIINARTKNNSKAKKYELSTDYVFDGLNEYPRPQMVRQSYVNLNGRWDLRITSANGNTIYEGDITVPFSPEARLSGVGHILLPNETLLYEKKIILNKSEGKRIILHFGAVDQCTFVDLNGQYIGAHYGGYTSFYFDITEAALDGENSLSVLVMDDTDVSGYARGKQKIKPGGMFYTAQSGIWQTVWVEYVDDLFIERLEIIPDIDLDKVQIKAHMNKAVNSQIADEAKILLDDSIAVDVESSYEGKVLSETVYLKDYELWNPKNPKLYYFSLKVGNDEVISYFAMRKYSVMADEKGYMRVCLNNEPVFINGVLDQGYYPESLMTPPSEAAMVDDINRAFDAGFNLIRKHCKIEPMRWYYHCDRLGMMVCQDFVNGGKKYDMKTVCYMPAIYHEWKKQSDKTRFLLNASGRTDSDTIKIWKHEATETVKQLINCPSIGMWTIFNEGWGQFDTNRCTNYIRSLDNTRVIDSASGWFDQGCGDIYSDHNYFFKLEVLPDEHKRAFMISEYGGFSLQIEGHVFKNVLYGYHPCFSKEEFIAECRKTQDNITNIIEKGLSGAIFTQLTDIEEEQNGLYTYDRKVIKFM